MEKRNTSVDILKIIACFSVVILHVSGIIANNINSNYTINHLLYYSSVLAVPIFFMVNGYLLLNKESLSYKYIINKIVSIIFVVFSWNLIMFVLKFLIGKGSNNPFIESAKSFLQKGYFWQFWFFGALIIIYSVLPVIHKYFRDNKTALIITLTFIIISLTVDILSIYKSFNGQSIIQVHVVQTFRIWTWFSYYLLGGLLGKEQFKNYLLNKISKKTNVIVVVISFFIINFYQYFIGKTLYNNTFAEYFYDNIFVFIYIISFFILILRQDFNKYRNRTIETISKNIMGVYIVHVTVLKICTHIFKFNTVITNIALICIVFIISLLSSIVISKIPLLKKLIKL